MLQAGTRLDDRYALLEPVARGGMGEVWRANDTVLGRVVAVKVLLPSLWGDPGFAERFRTEARAMAALSDPNIVEVYDYGQSHGVAYLVMQFVPGEPLHALLRRVGPLPPQQAMTLVAQAAHALHQAHTVGIVHRDVKPGNLLIRPDGRLVLTDFGIARIVAADGLTSAGEIIGTASYLAPEQVSGDPVSPATDVYALGVVAYECLTGTRPFIADTPVAIALMQTRDEPRPLPAALPEPVRHLVMRAMAKDPRQRWVSAAAMAQAASSAAAAAAGVRPLRMAPDGPVGAGPHTGGLRTGGLRTGGLRTGGPATGGVRPGGPRTGSLTAAKPTVAPSVPAHATVPRRVSEPAGHGRRRPRSLAWVLAAAILLTGVVGYAVFGQGPDDGVQAESLPSTSTSVTNSTSPSPTPTVSASATTASPSPTPSPSVSTVTVAAPPPSPTTPRTPGPFERVVPNVDHKYEIEADYVVRGASLVPDFEYTFATDRCWVVQQIPPAGSIVPVNSHVTIVVARSSPDCQPV